MRVGTAVPAALFKGKMLVFIVINRLFCKECDFLRQAVSVIWDFDSFFADFASPGKSLGIPVNINKILLQDTRFFI